MYKVSEDIIIKKRGSIFFALNMKTGTTYEMNESQFDIIQFFDGVEHSEAEVLDYLSTIYNVSVDDIRDEVHFAIEHSYSVGLLVRA